MGSSLSPQSQRDSSPRAVEQLLSEMLNVLPPLGHCVTAPLQGSGAALGQMKGATVMAAPFVIPMLNSVDFIAEDDYIADEGEDIAH